MNKIFFLAVLISAQLLAVDSDGQRLLAEAFYKKSVGLDDRKLESQWYDRAVNYGSTATIIERGIVLIKNKETALQGIVELQKSFEAGDFHAALPLAKIYDNGELVIRDEQLALRYFTAAADAKIWGASAELGLFLTRFHGDKCDIERTRGLIRADAIRGDNEAMHYLAVTYEDKNQKGYDVKRALVWYSASVLTENKRSKTYLFSLLRMSKIFYTHDRFANFSLAALLVRQYLKNGGDVKRGNELFDAMTAMMNKSDRDFLITHEENVWGILSEHMGKIIDARDPITP